MGFKPICNRKRAIEVYARYAEHFSHIEILGPLFAGRFAHRLHGGGVLDARAGCSHRHWKIKRNRVEEGGLGYPGLVLIIFRLLPPWTDFLPAN
jgi:hypothetical protein